MRAKYWVCRFLRRWKIYEPAYCHNCGALSFENVNEERIRTERWACDECGYVHASTFGGTWRVDSPEDYD